ncbi:hypothetical protein KKC32_05115 [Patescibacteria group bacterium]|nr:hypothetical protein [Patescibacteria group bacterium]
MFEQLFGSKTRVKLIRIFLDNPEKKFFVRELTRLSDSLINSVRRELENLVRMELILIEENTEKKPAETSGINSKKYYSLNPRNLFRQDLMNLFSKGKLLWEKKFIEKVENLGDVKYVCLGGIFVEDAKAETDVLIIGNVDRNRANSLLQKFEEEVGQAIKYTMMDEVEYNLRREIADKFLENIISNPRNLVIVDNLGK